jgi:hypothetical protein
MSNPYTGLTLDEWVTQRDLYQRELQVLLEVLMGATLGTWRRLNRKIEHFLEDWAFIMFAEESEELRDNLLQLLIDAVAVNSGRQ